MRPRKEVCALVFWETIILAGFILLRAMVALLALIGFLGLFELKAQVPYGCTIELVQTPDFVPVWHLQTWYQVGSERYFHILSVRPVTERNSLDKAKKECLGWISRFKPPAPKPPEEGHDPPSSNAVKL